MNIVHKLISILPESVSPLGRDYFNGLPGASGFHRIIPKVSEPEIIANLNSNQLVTVFLQLEEFADREQPLGLRRKVVANSISTINFFADYVIKNIDKFTIAELVDTAKDIATLWMRHADLFNDLAMKIALESIQDGGENQQFSDIASVFAAIGINGKYIFDVLVKAVEKNLDNFTMNQMVDMAWSFAVFDIFDEKLLSHFFSNKRLDLEQLAKPDIILFYQAFMYFSLKYPEAGLRLSPQNEDRIHRQLSDTDGLNHYRHEGQWLGQAILHDNILWQFGWEVIGIHWRERQVLQAAEDRDGILSEGIRKILNHRVG